MTDLCLLFELLFSTAGAFGFREELAMWRMPTKVKIK